MPAFRLQIMSDLHLETPKSRPSYEDFDIEPECQCLALLGDIGHASDPRLFDFFNRQLRQFEIVLYLLGNYEAYGTNFAEAKASIRTFEANVERRRRRSRSSPTSSAIGKFVFLDRTRYDLSPNLTVLGCTLFSFITPQQHNSAARFVSDFSNINAWTVESHNVAHHTDLQWLNSQVSECAQKEPLRSILVFTHHSPTVLEGTEDRKHILDNTQIRSAFTTDLSSQPCWTGPQVKLWAFGHTHFNCDVNEPQTGKRIVANQKGYRRSEALDFSASKVVEIDDSPNLEYGTSRVGLSGQRNRKRCTSCMIL